MMNAATGQMSCFMSQVSGNLAKQELASFTEVSR